MRAAYLNSPRAQARFEELARHSGLGLGVDNRSSPKVQGLVGALFARLLSR